MLIWQLLKDTLEKSAIQKQFIGLKIFTNNFSGGMGKKSISPLNLRYNIL